MCPKRLDDLTQKLTGTICVNVENGQIYMW